jgi:predicted dinucleotide-binding enzyme
MKINLIGAGEIGGTLTRRLTSLGHMVSVANSRGPASLAGLAAETGASPISVREAAHGAELVIVTIPMKNIPDLPEALFANTPEDVVIVDTNNYCAKQRDGKIQAIESGTAESRWVSEQLNRSVVKTFNNIIAEHLFETGKPAHSRGRIALPVAGDDGVAKATVVRLVDELGFDPVDAGGIDESWCQQPGAPAYLSDLGDERLREALARASKDRLPEWRA